MSKLDVLEDELSWGGKGYAVLDFYGRGRSATPVHQGLLPGRILDERISTAIIASPCPAPSVPAGGWIVPDNFHQVLPGLYRSSFPKAESFPFLRHLGLKSVLSLVQEDYPEEHAKFMDEIGIKHFQVGMPGNKVG